MNLQNERGSKLRMLLLALGSESAASKDGLLRRWIKRWLATPRARMWTVEGEGTACSKSAIRNFSVNRNLIVNNLRRVCSGMLYFPAFLSDAMHCGIWSMMLIVLLTGRIK